MKVIKFGGTSLGSPERMKNLVSLIDFSSKQIIVLSASTRKGPAGRND